MSGRPGRLATDTFSVPRTTCRAEEGVRLGRCTRMVVNHGVVVPRRSQDIDESTVLVIKGAAVFRRVPRNRLSSGKPDIGGAGRKLGRRRSFSDDHVFPHAELGARGPRFQNDVSCALLAAAEDRPTLKVFLAPGVVEFDEIGIVVGLIDEDERDRRAVAVAAPRAAGTALESRATSPLRRPITPAIGVEAPIPFDDASRCLDRVPHEGSAGGRAGEVPRLVGDPHLVDDSTARVDERDGVGTVRRSNPGEGFPRRGARRHRKREPAGLRDDRGLERSQRKVERRRFEAQRPVEPEHPPSGEIDRLKPEVGDLAVVGIQRGNLRDHHLSKLRSEVTGSLEKARSRDGEAFRARRAHRGDFGAGGVPCPEFG